MSEKIVRWYWFGRSEKCLVGFYGNVLIALVPSFCKFKHAMHKMPAVGGKKYIQKVHLVQKQPTWSIMLKA